jgi:hypothetical protein
MSVRLYMDVHVPRVVTLRLREHGVDVLTAQEDGAERFPDPQLLDRAAELGRVLFSQDDDLLAEASLRQRSNLSFTGIVYAHQLRATIGQLVSDLGLLAKASDPADLANLVIYLPLT